MAKICPLSNQPTLYLDCMDCEYKSKCKGNNINPDDFEGFEKQIEKH